MLDIYPLTLVLKQHAEKKSTQSNKSPNERMNNFELNWRLFFVCIKYISRNRANSIRNRNHFVIFWATQFTLMLPFMLRCGDYFVIYFFCTTHLSQGSQSKSHLVSIKLSVITFALIVMRSHCIPFRLSID